MARILFTGIPTYGLANPTLGLTEALVTAGHDVDYLMPEAFRDSVERCGARLLPYASYLNGRPVTRPIQAVAARILFDEVSTRTLQLGDDYDLVVASGLQPQFERIQAGLRTPVARFSPIFWQNSRTLSELMDHATGLPGPIRHGLATPWLRRAASGVVGRALLGNQGRDVAAMLSPQSATLNLTVASRHYQPHPEEFGDTCVYLGPTSTPAPTATDADLDRVASHPGPVVYVTLGTVYNGWLSYFRRVADAFAGTDALVVIATGRAESAARIGAVADNIMVRGFVPQAAVLAHASLYLGHAGFGSVTDAALAGVPMIVTPLGGDQFFNAARLAQLGAATVLSAHHASRSRMSSLAQAHLQNRTLPPGAALLTASFREAGGSRLGVERIEALLAR